MKFSVTYIDVNNMIPYRDAELEVYTDVRTHHNIAEAALVALSEANDEVLFAGDIDTVQCVTLGGWGHSYIFNLDGDEGMILIRQQS